tara:strand:- start:1288 stop:1881 length:594 start_codon:yes stop_codon:yes gene_type:complete
MSKTLSELQARISALEDEFERELAARRSQFKYIVENRRVKFEAEARRHHRRLRTGLLRFLRRSPIMHYVTAPVIYSLALPIVLLDIFVSVYQWVCFPVYGIRKVKRSNYIALDRRNLSYLNLIEKLNCEFCGYANGVIAYVREVASRTEQYWCPIKHSRRVSSCHHRYYNFIDYGDADGFRTRAEKLRENVRNEGDS